MKNFLSSKQEGDIKSLGNTFCIWEKSSIFAINYWACLKLGNPDPIDVVRFGTLWTLMPFWKMWFHQLLLGLLQGHIMIFSDVFGLLDKLGDITVSSGFNLTLS